MSHPYFTQQMARDRYDDLVGTARAARLGQERSRRQRPRRNLRDWFDDRVRRPALALLGRPTSGTCSALTP
jgi:hypothetical protein